jgi:hypothetical protein
MKAESASVLGTSRLQQRESNVGSRTSQPATSNRAGVSHAGRTTSEPFDAVSERMHMRTAPWAGGPSPRWLVVQSANAPIAWPEQSHAQTMTGPRTCPACPSHTQNEGLPCEVSAVGMAFSDGLFRLRVGKQAGREVER